MMQSLSTNRAHERNPGEHAQGRHRSRRGSILVIVVGVLALMAILVTIYATLGQADRRTSATFKQQRELNSQASEVAEYLYTLIAADVFVAERRSNPTVVNNPNLDRYIRSHATNPSIDPRAMSQTTRPWERYRPTYFAGDQRPATEVLPPSNFPPGAVLTRWSDPANPDANVADPRTATTPWLASAKPDWLRLNDNGAIPGHQDPNRPWLDDRDWGMLSNPAPDGRFVNLAAVRNNWSAKSGVGLDPVTGRAMTTHALTLLDDLGRPTLDLALPPFWGLQRTAVSWDPAGNGLVPYFPHDFTARQRGMVRLPIDARPGNLRIGTLDRAYLDPEPTTISPGDWEYFDNQFADTDNDGVFDARWFEARDASDPGNDGRFGTPDDIVRSLIRENPDLRLFVAARIIDLSSKANVNTATQFRTEPGRLAQAGLRPSDVDLQRLLTMTDVYSFFPRAGYEALAQPPGPHIEGTPSFPSNYRLQVPYDANWTLSGVDRRVADTVGATAFSALIEARVSGQVPAPGVNWSAGPNDRYGPLKVRAGLWPFDATQGELVQASLWRPEYRTALYDAFGQDPSAKMLTSYQSRRYGPWLGNGGDPIAAIRSAAADARDVAPAGVFGIQSEIELLTHAGVNDSTTTSALELTIEGRFGKVTGPSYARFTPLRSNRPRDLETLARDLTRPTPTGFVNQPDGNIDADALLQNSIDVRSLLTTVSGARRLAPTDVTGNLDTLADSEVAVNLPQALAILSAPLLEQGQQAVRQQQMDAIFKAAADALLPFAALRDNLAVPQQAAWYVTRNTAYFPSPAGLELPRPEQKLFYGGDRAYLDNSDQPATYFGNAAEQALRLTGHWAVNLAALRRTPRTLLDPVNPIHPDDVQSDATVIDRLWQGVPGVAPTDLAVNTDLWAHPGAAGHPLPDADYFRRPRFPRGQWANVPNSTAQLEQSLAYTDATEFRLNNQNQLVPFRTRSEAWDRPVVFSMLIDEGFRNKMGFNPTYSNAFGVNENYRAFPGWSNGDVGQLGELAARLMGRLDLGDRGTVPKLCPGDGIVNPTNTQGSPAGMNRDAKLSARALNVFGIVPQPFVVQAMGFVFNADTPPGAGDPGDTDGPVGGGGQGAGNYQVTLRPRILDRGGAKDELGNLIPAANQRGFPDHVVEVFAFQLHNPFDVPLSLSATLDGRTFPDQTRRAIRQDRDGTGLSSNQYVGEQMPPSGQAMIVPAPQPGDLFYPRPEDTRYYIEFGQRYYAMVGTNYNSTERRAITLEPGETRWFYVTDNDLDQIFDRMDNASTAGSPNRVRDMIPSGARGEDLIENWLANLLVTNEPLGMSQVNTAERDALGTVTGSANLRDLKSQPVFQNPPTRLLQVNPRTMRPQNNAGFGLRSVTTMPMPTPGDIEGRRRFVDSRRAVRLWRVNREVPLTENLNVGDNSFTREGQQPTPSGYVEYQGENNLVQNDHLVDVLRDPKPWRSDFAAQATYETVQTESQWTTPTLHRRLPDTAPVLTYNSSPALNARRIQGMAFINWGSIRRPSDPKVSVPLYRNQPTNLLLPEVPTGVLPAYCIEVKSTLPDRAGLVVAGRQPYALRTSLNWDLVNGERRISQSYSEVTTMDVPPFARPPTNSQLTGVIARFPGNGTIEEPDYARIALLSVSDDTTHNALGTLVARHLGKNERSRPNGAIDNIPARFDESINLAPQLQDTRSAANGRRTDTQPDFNAPTSEYHTFLHDRLERMKNRSGIEFSRLYMTIPMLRPPTHRPTDREVSVAEMRQGDLLMIPAVGPYEIPLDPAGRPWEQSTLLNGVAGVGLEPHDQRVLDFRWTTLAEAAAAALDYDYDDAWKHGTGLPAPYQYMPADYRQGAMLPYFDYDYEPDPSGMLPENRSLGGCLERGCLRTDRFVAYLDQFDGQGNPQPDGRFSGARQRQVNGPLVGDMRMGNGVPMALTLLDKFNTMPFGSKDSKIAGLVNLSTAPLQVKRALAMASPDPLGWMGPFGGLDSGGAVLGTTFDPRGTVYERDLFGFTDGGAFTPDQERQVRSMYSPWLETFDVGATLEAYGGKKIVRTRPIQANGNLNSNLGIDVGFRDDFAPYANAERRGPGFNEPVGARQAFTSIPGLREQTGFRSIGEVLCARQDLRFEYNSASITGQSLFNSDSDKYKLIVNYQDLANEGGFALDSFGNVAGSNPADPKMTFFADVSIDRFARDARRLAPSSGWTNAAAQNFDDNLGYYTGRPAEGIMSNTTTDRAHQRSQDMPSAAMGTLDEKYVIANGLLNSVSVRSDVFCVWFKIRGYSPADVSGLRPEDPMIPSLERRYVMVVDRSNVTRMGEKPRVLFMQEVPVN